MPVDQTPPPNALTASYMCHEAPNMQLVIMIIMKAGEVCDCGQCGEEAVLYLFFFSIGFLQHPTDPSWNLWYKSLRLSCVDVDASDMNGCPPSTWLRHMECPTLLHSPSLSQSLREDPGHLHTMPDTRPPPSS